MEASQKTKKCINCNITKTFNEFHNYVRNSDGLRSYCKICRNLSNKKHIKTKRGLITRIFGSQKQSCIERKHQPPQYTNDELQQWCMNQSIFYKLYDDWVDSGYEKDLSPSVDRLDDYKTYSFDNIQLMTWGENRAKCYEDTKSGKLAKKFKKVSKYDKAMNFICRYNSVKSASDHTGIFANSISYVCKGKRKTAGGFRWKYAN